MLGARRCTAQHRLLTSTKQDPWCVFSDFLHKHICANAQGVNNATDEDGEFWWYQSCTEQPMPFARDGGAPLCCACCCCCH